MSEDRQTDSPEDKVDGIASPTYAYDRETLALKKVPYVSSALTGLSQLNIVVDIHTYMYNLLQLLYERKTLLPSIGKMRLQSRADKPQDREPVPHAAHDMCDENQADEHLDQRPKARV